ncbi:MAG: putative succinate dehydrogenase [membrane anchor subunit] (succinic dehydrogenase), partial [uncultured Frankineae bacterium]
DDDRAAPAGHGRACGRRRPHAAHRPLVAPAVDHGHGAGGVHRLLDPAGLRERQLLRGALHLAVLLALPDRRLPGRHVPRAVLRTVVPQPGAVHPHRAAGLPPDLLLLPQGLLPVVLALPAGVRGRRAAPDLHGGDPVPARLPERAPVLLLPRPGLQRDPHVRRRPRVPQRAGGVVPHGARHPRAADQRGPALAVLAVVPLLPAHRRRAAQALLRAPRPLPRLDRRLPAQRAPHAAGLDQPDRRRPDRPLRPPPGHRGDHRPDVLL